MDSLECIPAIDSFGGGVFSISASLRVDLPGKGAEVVPFGPCRRDGRSGSVLPKRAPHSAPPNFDARYFFPKRTPPKIYIYKIHC